jgi:hypothetical protein
MTRRVALAGLLALALASPTRAGFIATFAEAGSDVVATGDGSLNLSVLTGPTQAGALGVVFPAGPAVVLGTSNFGLDDFYQGASGPSALGPGGQAAPDSGALTHVGVTGASLIVPHDYQSGKPLTSSSTWANTTLSGLGLTPGTYTWTWGSGPTADFFTVQIGPVTPAVPAPPTLLLGRVGAGSVARLRRPARPSNHG